MKFAKLFMIVAVATLLTSCAEYHLYKAEKAIDNEEYVDAAKSLSKIDGDDVEDWIEDSPSKGFRIGFVVMAISVEGNSKSQEIIKDWLEREVDDIDEFEDMHEVFNFLDYNFEDDDYYY